MFYIQSVYILFPLNTFCKYIWMYKNLNAYLYVNTFIIYKKNLVKSVKYCLWHHFKKRFISSGCEIHAYDHTVADSFAQAQAKPGFFIHKKGIDVRSSSQMTTLQDELIKHNHRTRIINYLKVNIFIIIQIDNLLRKLLNKVRPYMKEFFWPTRH